MVRVLAAGVDGPGLKTILSIKELAPISLLIIADTSWLFDSHFFKRPSAKGHPSKQKIFPVLFSVRRTLTHLIV